MNAQAATAMQAVRGSVPVSQNTPDFFEQFEMAYLQIARRAFELSERRNHHNAHELDDWLRAESEILHPVHIEMTESEEELEVRAEVPGFSAKDLEIKVDPHFVRIAGKRDEGRRNGGRKIRSEWHKDQILRAVNLPVDVDPAHVNASIKDGILIIDLPKAAHSKPCPVLPWDR